MSKPKNNQSETSIARYEAGDAVVSVVTVPGKTVFQTYAVQIDAARKRIAGDKAPKGYEATDYDALRLLCFNLKAFATSCGASEADLAEKSVKLAWEKGMEALRAEALKAGIIPTVHAAGYRVIGVSQTRYSGIDSKTGVPTELRQSVRLAKTMTRLDRSQWVAQVNSAVDRLNKADEAAEKAAAAEKK